MSIAVQDDPVEIASETTPASAVGDFEAHDDVVTDVDGVEQEETEPDVEGSAIHEPFDPTQIRVKTWSPTIDLLMTRVRNNEIDLMPDFQRAAGIWGDKDQSRLIESLLIRIPLPAFYMDATDEDRLVVVDGLQRLTTLRRFVINQELKLKGLEFLDELEGKVYDELPRQLQRRIEETQVTVYLIEKGTPDKVKYTIFKRINTGGLPLSAQEIRHALNPGPATVLLKTLTTSDEFEQATNGGISNSRMADRECVLRFMAFRLTNYSDYDTRDFDHFLHQTMARLNEMPEIERLHHADEFRKSLVVGSQIFDDDAFRKRYDPDAMRHPINKALFEAWSVNLASRTDDEQDVLIERKDHVRREFRELMHNDREFVDAVSFSTGVPKNVHRRFGRIDELLRRVLECSNPSA